jgi:hypothetical protein
MDVYAEFSVEFIAFISFAMILIAAALALLASVGAHFFNHDFKNCYQNRFRLWPRTLLGFHKMARWCLVSACFLFGANLHPWLSVLVLWCGLALYLLRGSWLLLMPTMLYELFSQNSMTNIMLCGAFIFAIHAVPASSDLSVAFSSVLLVLAISFEFLRRKRNEYELEILFS